MPIVEKDGRVRHVKGVGEEVKKRPEGAFMFNLKRMYIIVVLIHLFLKESILVLGFFPGAFVQITGGVHRDLYGKVIICKPSSYKC